MKGKTRIAIQKPHTQYAIVGAPKVADVERPKWGLVETEGKYRIDEKQTRSGFYIDKAKPQIKDGFLSNGCLRFGVRCARPLRMSFYATPPPCEMANDSVIDWGVPSPEGVRPPRSGCLRQQPQPIRWTGGVTRVWRGGGHQMPGGDMQAAVGSSVEAVSVWCGALR